MSEEEQAAKTTPSLPRSRSRIKTGVMTKPSNQPQPTILKKPQSMSTGANFASFAQESSRVTFQEDGQGGANNFNDQTKKQDLLLAESQPIINVTLRNHSQDSLKLTNYGPYNDKDADLASQIKAADSDGGLSYIKLGMSRNAKINNSARSKVSYIYEQHSKHQLRTDTGLAQAYLSPGKLRSEPRNRSQQSQGSNNTSLKKVQSEFDRNQRLTNKLSRKFRVSMPEEQLEAMQSQSDDEDSQKNKHDQLKQPQIQSINLGDKKQELASVNSSQLSRNFKEALAKMTKSRVNAHQISTVPTIEKQAQMNKHLGQLEQQVPNEESLHTDQSSDKDLTVLFPENDDPRKEEEPVSMNLKQVQKRIIHSRNLTQLQEKRKEPMIEKQNTNIEKQPFQLDRESFNNTSIINNGVSQTQTYFKPSSIGQGQFIDNSLMSITDYDMVDTKANLKNTSQLSISDRQDDFMPTYEPFSQNDVPLNQLPILTKQFKRRNANPVQLTNQTKVGNFDSKQKQPSSFQIDDDSQFSNPINKSRFASQAMISGEIAQVTGTLDSSLATIKRQSTFGEDQESTLQGITISKISRDYEQISKTARRKKMNNHIDDLINSNKTYFCGSQVSYENDSNYLHCIADPRHPANFIAASEVNTKKLQEYSSMETITADDSNLSGTGTKEELQQSLRLRDFIDDNELFNEDQQDVSVIQYAKTQIATRSIDLNKGEFTIISFWRPNEEDDQFECTRFESQFNVFRKQISHKTPHSEKIFFTSDIGKVFFFGELHGKLYLKIIQEDNSISSQLIESKSLLEDQLDYQLTKHLTKNLYNMSLPDPNIVRIEDEQFLVLTTVENKNYPSVSLFLIPPAAAKAAQSDVSSSEYYTLQSGTSISGTPKFSIKGAELFLGVDQEGKIRFMSNELVFNGSEETLEDTKADFPRLVSPYLVKEILVTQLSSWKENGIEPLIGMLPEWEVEADDNSMNFFRCYSHQYSSVQLVKSDQAPDLITLSFSGNEFLVDMVVQFRLKTRLSSGIQSPIPYLKLTGHITNQYEEQVEVNLEVEQVDYSGSVRANGSVQAGSEFQMTNEVLGAKWISNSIKAPSIKVDRPGKQRMNLRESVNSNDLSHMINQQPTPSTLMLQNGNSLDLTIEELQIDTYSGKITGGTATLKGNQQMFDISPVADKNEEFDQDNNQRLYPKERMFKLNLENSQLDPMSLDKYTIEGTLLNDVFNTQITGRIMQTDFSGHIIKSSNFSIKKVSQEKLSFEFVQGDENEVKEFNVLISGRIVQSAGNVIEMSGFEKPQHLLKYVHRVIANEHGTYVMHGDLSSIIQQKVVGGTSQEKQDSTFLFLSHFSPREFVRKDYVLTSEEKLKEMFAKSSMSSLPKDIIQAISVDQETMQLTFAARVPEQLEGGSDCTIVFIRENLVDESDEREAENDNVKMTVLVQDQWSVDYPFLAYKSFLPDNSEIVLANMAERQKISQIVNIGEKWQFFCFVESTVQDKHLKINLFQRQIYFLARNKDTRLLSLLALVGDPWSSDKKLTLIAIKSCKISLPPSPVEQLKCVHLISKNDSQGVQVSLFFQFVDQIWSVSLDSEESKAIPAFDPEMSQRRMMPRKAVRGLYDSNRIYCIAESGMRERIIRIELESKDRLNVMDIYESSNARILAIEPDPESTNNFYIIDEEQKVQKIHDDGESKVQILQTIDMSVHNLEDELEHLDSKPWTSMVINDRVLQHLDTCFSMNSRFSWKAENSGGYLLSEVSLNATLRSLQIRRKNKQLLFVLKPLAGCNIVDLLGQVRSTNNKLGYFATDQKILIQTEEDRILVFDKDGYILHEEDEAKLFENTSMTIVTESVSNSENSKYFLLQNISNEYTLLQSTLDGFSEIFSGVKYDELRDSMLNEPGANQLFDNLGLPKSQSDQDNRSYVAENFKKSLKLHQRLSFPSKTGELIIVATAVVDQTPELLTIFEPEIIEQEKEGTNLFSGVTKLVPLKKVNNDGYKSSTRLIGYFKRAGIKIVVFLCWSKEQQDDLIYNGGLEDKSKQKRKSERRKSSTIDINEKSAIKFGLIDTKLVWMSQIQKQVQFVDIDALEKSQNKSQSQSINWAQVSCSSFSVKDLLSGMSKDDLNQKGIFIEEVPRNSVFYKKSLRFKGNSQTLMQITIGQHAIVYNLQDTNRYEVGLLSEFRKFQNQISFGNTGFTIKTSQIGLHSNLDSSLCLLRPNMGNVELANKLLIRACSEIDLQQIDSVNATINKIVYSKNDVDDIEFETLLKLYGGETFFSLFAEETPVFDFVLTLIQGIKQEILNEAPVKANLAKTLPKEPMSKGVLAKIKLKYLLFVLDRPVPVAVQKNSHLTDHSVVKQSLLFSDQRATQSLMKVADAAGLYLSDYIDCIDDLQLIIEKLPQQQSRKVMNRLKSCQKVFSVPEAVMGKRGETAKLKSFIKKSEVLSESIPELGLNRTQTDEEVLQPVKIRVMPLHWIEESTQTDTDVYQFMRQNLVKLQGTLVLDAIFSAYWDEQRQIIFSYFFVPFFIYFVLTNFYMAQCLLGDLHQIGIWSSICEAGEECKAMENTEFVLRWTLIIYIVFFQSLIEILQIRADGFKIYISQASNKFDIFSILMNLTTLILVTVDYDMYKTRIIASLAVGTLWMLLFFWLRLFDNLAQYVELIYQTVFDVKYFMFVLLSLLLMVQIGFHMIQINRLTPPIYGKEPLFDYDANEGSLFSMGLLFQYKYFLGEIADLNLIRSSEGYDAEQSRWILLENIVAILYFFFSTFITQIVILNMLIAIMAATYSRHEEDLQENAKRQKLVLQSEFAKLAGFLRKYVCFCCTAQQKKGKQDPADQLFVVTVDQRKLQDQGEDDEDGKKGGKSSRNAAGGGDMRLLIESKFKILDTFLIKKMMKALQDFQLDTSTRLEAIERLGNASQDDFKNQILSKFSIMNKKLDSIKKDGMGTLEEMEVVKNALANHINALETKMTANIGKYQRESLLALHRVSVGRGAFE